MSAECKKLRGPNDTGPDCGCRGDACALPSRLPWKPGQRCQLVDLRKGKVLAGKIEVVRGHKMVVATVDGQRWSADVDSSFVQRPK